MTQNRFCKAFSNALTLRVPGDSNVLTFSPCCLYRKYIPFHERVVKKTREQFQLVDDFPSECNICKVKEQFSGTSLRHALNDNIPDLDSDDIYRIELVLDTTCNAACIQCGPDQSSLWRKFTSNDKKVFHIQPEQQIDDKLEAIRKNIDLSHVRNVYIWGGEPFITDTHLKFLNLLPNKRETAIEYTTNVSTTPSDELLDLWRNFGHVSIGLSVDDIGDRFEYIRWPLKWDKVSRNIETYKNLPLRNLRLHMNTCVLGINAFYLDEIDKTFKHEFRINYIKGEGIMGPESIPPSLRQEIISKFGDDHQISKLMRILPSTPAESMINALASIDQQRQLNWKQRFAEVAAYY